MCKAPNLKNIRLAYHPITSIEPYAFDHLQSLHWLDLSGNAVEQPMDLMTTHSLSMTSATNFSELSMSYWSNLKSFEPGFISNIQPHACLDFLDSGIEIISKEAFYDVFQTLASYDGDVTDIYRPPGRITFGRNPLKCGCDIKWIVEDPQMLKIIDDVSFDHRKPICEDGTFVSDLDLSILEILCPDNK